MSFSLFSLHLALHNVTSFNNWLSPFVLLVWSYIVIFSKKIYMIETSHKSLYFLIQKVEILMCDFDLRLKVAWHYFEKKLSKLNITFTQQSIRWPDPMQLSDDFSLLVCLPIFDFPATVSCYVGNLLKWVLE